jgi:ferredoxin
MPRVSIKDTNASFEVQEGDILYDSLADQGLKLPHGCLSGSCGACRIEILEGQENLQPASPVEQNTIEALKEEFRQNEGSAFLENKIIRLSCRAKVQGNLTIRPIK